MRNETQSKHTPGPWTREDSTEIVAKGKQGLLTVARCYDTDIYTDGSGGDPQANARLIAAAPDLLEACNAIAEYYDLIKQNYPDLPGLIKGISLARAAIAKAMGGGE